MNFLIRRNRWPALGLALLGVLFVLEGARGQLPAGRPPVRMPGRGLPNQPNLPVQPNILNMPNVPNLPNIPNPPAMPNLPVPGNIMVWSCGNCNRELSRGLKPVMTTCPFCGAVFTNTGMGGFVPRDVPAAEPPGAFGDGRPLNLRPPAPFPVIQPPSVEKSQPSASGGAGMTTLVALAVIVGGLGLVVVVIIGVVSSMNQGGSKPKRRRPVANDDDDEEYDDRRALRRRRSRD